MSKDLLTYFNLTTVFQGISDSYSVVCQGLGVGVAGGLFSRFMLYLLDTLVRWALLVRRLYGRMLQWEGTSKDFVKATNW